MKKSSEVTRAVRSHVSASWVDEELSGCQFEDTRHGARLHSLLESMSERVGKSIPSACEDWANTKAAYRLFANDRITDKEILSGHFEATSRRVSDTEGPVLILHDTTDVIFKRGEADAVGFPRERDGEVHTPTRRHTKYHVLMHGSLVVTPTGQPMGLSAATLWARPDNTPRQTLSDRAYKALPLEKKESFRWFDNIRQSTERLSCPQRCIHIGDREADVLALFHFVRDNNTHFLVRINYNRPTDEDGVTINSRMKAAPLAGTRQISFKDPDGQMQVADLQVKFCRMKLTRSSHKRKDFEPIEVTIIHAFEKTKPAGRPRLEWKLATDLEITSLADALEKLEWYALRWKIETFHKILKSGCKVEESKVRDTHRLSNLIAVNCILAWRIFYMTMLNRSQDNASPALVFTELECLILDRKVKDKRTDEPKTLAHYITKVARLGGYLNRANDPPPGNIVMWRGLTRLADIVLGAEIGAGLVGN